MSGTSDHQCKLILQGVEKLIALLAQPLVREALTIDRSPDTATYENHLDRIRWSLRQYIERRTELVYIGCVGHFSAGKSSTINSLLGVWDAPTLRRAVDNNPTDKVITLITHPDNEGAVLATARAGRIPVGDRYVPSDFLRHIVVADTPGTGDPLLVREIASEFLPLCDRILFFFSAASPFDEADVPILREIRRRLQFIPLEFVVTRADEFRRDKSQLVSAENIDDERVSAFLSKVFDRVIAIPELEGCASAPRHLVDNYAAYGVEALRSSLLASTDPSDLRVRVEMHEHKVQYFRAYALECHEHLSSRIKERFNDVDDVVDNAERNVKEFEAHIKVATPNIHTAWSDQMRELGVAREYAVNALPENESPPSAIVEHPVVERTLALTSTALQNASRSIAFLLVRRVTAMADSQLRTVANHMSRLVASIDISTARGDEITIPTPSTLRLDEGDLDLFSPAFKQTLRDVRNSLPTAINQFVDDGAKATSSLQQILEVDRFGTTARAAIKSATDVLREELNRYYHIVELYHTGVIGRKGFGLIARLDIGRRIDRSLEDEKRTDDLRSIGLEAERALLVQLETASTTYDTATSVVRQACSDAMSRRPPYLRRPEIDDTWLDDLGRTERENIFSDIEEKAKAEIEQASIAMSAAASTQLTAAIRQYADKLATLNRQRRKRLFKMSLTVGAICTAIGLLYLYRDVATGPSWSVAVGLSILANVLGDLGGYLLGRLTDPFPKSGAELASAETQEAIQAMQSAAATAMHGRSQLVLSEEFMAARVLKFFNHALREVVAAEAAIYASSEYLAAQEFANTAEVMRQRYLVALDDLWQLAVTTLGNPKNSSEVLGETSRQIRARSIDRSFQILDEVRKQTEQTSAELSSIRFA